MLLFLIAAQYSCALRAKVSKDVDTVGTLIPENGLIDRDSTWSGEVRLDRDILVFPNVTLTIAPGTHIIFAPTRTSLIEPRFLFTKHELLVQGRLMAKGSAEAAIIFTSGDVKPAEGNWAGIILDNPKGGDSLLEYCRIEYAEIGVYCINASPQINKSLLQNNQTGIICQRGSHPHINANVIKSGEIGIACWDKAAPKIENNEISQEKQAGLVWAEATPVLMRNSIRGNKYGLYGDESLEWANNQIEGNAQDFYLSPQVNHQAGE